jgi:hypothetical protein
MTKKELKQLNEQQQRLVKRLNQAANNAGFKTPKENKQND